VGAVQDAAQPEEQSIDKAMLRRVMDAAIDCDQSIFLNGLT
jgi:hypothetical protein